MHVLGASTEKQRCLPPNLTVCSEGQEGDENHRNRSRVCAAFSQDGYFGIIICSLGADGFPQSRS